MSQDRLELGRRAAAAAAELTLTYFQTDQFTVERKGDDSPVTVADRGAEQLLREMISKTFPDDAILGEEFPEKPGSSGYQWILDPIDGTKSFIHGVPLYGTLIGLRKESEPIAGIIEIPGLNERIFAAKGEGAWFQRGNGELERAQVSPTVELDQCLFLTSSYAGFEQRGAAAVFRKLCELTYVTRTWGDCYGYLLVATGNANIMVDPLMSVWDAAALLPVLTEAGGVYTDWSGNPTIDGGEGIATNPQRLPAVLEVTARFSKRT